MVGGKGKPKRICHHTLPDYAAQICKLYKFLTIFIGLDHMDIEFLQGNRILKW
jgi:hypothetical protein